MYFQQTDLFQGMDKSFIKQLIDISVKETYDEGIFIFHYGDKANSFYVLLKGCVKLNVGDLGHVTHVVDHAGESFGWSSLVGRDIYSASAECILPTKVIRVEKKECFRVFAENANSGMILFQRLAALLGERLIRNYEEMSQVAHAEVLPAYGTGQTMDIKFM